MMRRRPRELEKLMFAWARYVFLSFLSLYPDLKGCLWQSHLNRFTDWQGAGGTWGKVLQWKCCTNSASRAVQSLL